jgi:chaperonin GroEL (HSP60 family)
VLIYPRLLKRYGSPKITPVNPGKDSTFNIFHSLTVPALQVSLIIHGTTPQNCEEIHRSIDDALQTLRALSQNDPSVNSKTKGRGRLVLGGGCIEFNLSMRMRHVANEAEGIEQVSTLPQHIRILLESTN